MSKDTLGGQSWSRGQVLDWSPGVNLKLLIYQYDFVFDLMKQY
ncbi:hypothetical protein POL25_31820 [Nannocystis sp. bb15-2]|uniref:Uncharacterized protein n=1 Tax=Nannocystis bainbridge TaxID=2995303 RepID=A0ABT5E872_9BACT|nr:hypothetical protein [Nannocystis bainbridge]